MKPSTVKLVGHPISAATGLVLPHLIALGILFRVLPNFGQDAAMVVFGCVCVGAVPSGVLIASTLWTRVHWPLAILLSVLLSATLIVGSFWLLQYWYVEFFYNA